MSDANGSAAYASLVFLGVADFARKPVAEQAGLRERLDAAVVRALAALAPADRIVADASDGVAVAVLGVPADALLLARRMRRLARGEGGEPFPIRIGVNHGPIRLGADDHGEPCLVGDGVVAGAAVAGFSAPDRILVSRSFRDALEPADPERAARLRAAGTQTDASLRSYELYSFETTGSDPGAATTGTSAFAQAESAAPPAPRRRLLLVGGASVAGILAAGIVARVARRAVQEAKRPAVVELAILPWGEVMIDGVSKGRTPPLKRLEVPPGKHTIEIRHPAHPPVALKVALDAGEELNVRHTFAPVAAPPAQSQPREPQPSRARRMWNDFRKQAGF